MTAIILNDGGASFAHDQGTTMNNHIADAVNAIHQAITTGSTDLTVALHPLVNRLTSSGDIIKDIAEVVRVMRDTMGADAATNFGRGMLRPAGAIMLLADALASGKEPPEGGR